MSGFKPIAPPVEKGEMSSRTVCDGCGGSNGATAAFCGQCFAPLSAAGGSSSTFGGGTGAVVASTAYRPARLGAPVAAPAYPGSGSAPAVSPPARGNAVEVSAGVKWLLFLVAAAAAFFGVKFFLFGGGTTFAAEDGSYEFTYSDYWKEAGDTSQFPSFEGVQIDTMLESENAMVVAMHGPAPVGDVGQLNGSLIEQGFESAPMNPQIEEWSVPGKRAMGGEPSLFDATGYVEIAGMRAEIDLVMGVTSGAERNAVVLVHSCFEAECSASTPEFESILDSMSLGD